MAWSIGVREREALAFTDAVKKVVFDIKPHLSDQDELELHAAEHYRHAAHALSG